MNKKGLKIVFYGTPAYGHVNSVHPVIHRLVENGHKVTWYCTNKFKRIIENTGATYREYTIDFDSKYSLDKVTSNFGELFETLINLNERLYEDYLYTTAAMEPDIIMYDSMCSFAKNIAYSLNIKSVCLCTTLAFNHKVLASTSMLKPTIKLVVTRLKSLAKLIKKESAFRKKHKLRKLDVMDTFINKGDITIVFTPPEFQPYRESFDKTFKFVGTTIRDRLSTGSINYDNYDIYISIGSISSFNNTVNKGLLQRILSTEYMTYRDGSINGRKILVSGAESIANKLNNVECVKSTEQLRVLSNVDLFINHGGINSIFESLWFGVPQICIPMQEEQKMVALTMEKKGFVICAGQARPFNI